MPASKFVIERKVMDVTITAKDLSKVSNLTKALRKASYENIRGDELAALSVCMFWIHDLEVQLKKAEPVKTITKPKVKKAKKKNVRSKPVTG